jgi:hypothetical protein
MLSFLKTLKPQNTVGVKMPVANPVYNALFNEIKSLPEDYTYQVMDFVGYLKEKAARKSECPICINSIPNAETIAAIQEGRAMMRGEIPAKRFSSLDEMWEDLERHDPELDD